MRAMEECDSVLLALRKISRAVDLHSKKLENKFGVTGPQMLILKEIVKMGQVPTSVLARNVNLSHATVTSILDRLKNKGYIERVRDNKDKRKVLVKSTQVGDKVLTTNPTLLQESFVKEFIQLKDWERAQIVFILQKVAGMMTVVHLNASDFLSDEDL